MSNLQTQSEASSINDGLYDFWKANQQWKDKLYKKASHKALDIPEDDMNINSGNVTHNHYLESNQPVPKESAISKPKGSILTKALLGAALVGSGAGVGIGIPLLLDSGKDVVKEVIEKDTGIKDININPGFGQPS